MDDRKKLIQTIKTYKGMLQKQNKIINAMANYIYDNNAEGIICKENKKADCEPCDACIRQYFEKKV